jgi:hypothetical protein
MPATVATPVTAMSAISRSAAMATWRAQLLGGGLLSPSSYGHGYPGGSVEKWGGHFWSFPLTCFIITL